MKDPETMAESFSILVVGIFLVLLLLRIAHMVFG